MSQLRVVGEPDPHSGGSGLRSFYEQPTTTLRAGSELAAVQAELVVKALDAAAHAPEEAPKALVVIDLGCGDGTITSTIAEACREFSSRSGRPVTVLAVDWSAAGTRDARAAGLVAVRSSLEAPGLSFTDGCADVVVMSELLEHLVDPDAALEEAARLLRPGGRLVLSTPNLAAWYNRFLLLLGVQPVFSEVSLQGIYGRPGSEVVGHLRLFTRRALVQLLVARGFSDVEIRGAPFHDVPWVARPLDRLLCATPSLASLLVASAGTRS